MSFLINYVTYHRYTKSRSIKLCIQLVLFIELLLWDVYVYVTYVTFRKGTSTKYGAHLDFYLV